MTPRRIRFEHRIEFIAALSSLRTTSLYLRHMFVSEGFNRLLRMAENAVLLPVIRDACSGKPDQQPILQVLLLHIHLHTSRQHLKAFNLLRFNPTHALPGMAEAHGPPGSIEIVMHVSNSLTNNGLSCLDIAFRPLPQVVHFRLQTRVEQIMRRKQIILLFQLFVGLELRIEMRSIFTPLLTKFCRFRVNAACPQFPDSRRHAGAVAPATAATVLRASGFVPGEDAPRLGAAAVEPPPPCCNISCC
mmetsp:Transcript_122365/g.243575  ORF Transcript_122365/g.243575 Transcript_122365/m.243575 type:complete len:246 (+) Transcript_122365:800-1537(+)